MVNELAVPLCKHDDFVVKGPNLIGEGTCLHCNKTIRLGILLNAWKARIEAELKELVKEVRRTTDTRL